MATQRQVKATFEPALKPVLSFAERLFFVGLVPLGPRLLTRSIYMQVAHA